MNEEINQENDRNNSLEDLKETVIARFSNPFVYSYIFSWIIFNWTFISFMFFSNYTIEKKLTNYGHYINFSGWIYPLIGVAFYLLVLNYIDTFFLYLSKDGYKQKIEELKNKSSIKIQADIQLALEKIDLQSKKIKADEIEVLIKETKRLSDVLEGSEKELIKKDSLIANLKKENDLNKSKSKTIRNDTTFINRPISSFGTGYGLSPIRSMEDTQKLLEEANLIDDFILISKNGKTESYNFGFTSLNNSENTALYIKLGLVDRQTSMLTEFGKKMNVFLKAGRA